MSEIIPWPLFVPKQQLQAGRLQALEEYLLSATRVQAASHQPFGAESSASGVAYLDLRKSLRQDSKANVLWVSELRGLTPAGYPVMLQAEEQVESHAVTPPNVRQAPWQGDLPLSAEVDDGLWNVSVEVGISGADSGDRKLSLVVDSITDDESTLAPALQVNRLFLGTYEIMGRKVTLKRRPLVYSFSAIHPLDDEWREWTNEFEFTISRVIQKLSERYRHAFAEGRFANPGLMSAMVLASELQASWTELSWSEIAHRVKVLRRIYPEVAIDIAKTAHADVEAPIAFEPETADGESQPKQMSELLFPGFTNVPYYSYPLGTARTMAGDVVYVEVLPHPGLPTNITCRLIPAERARNGVMYLCAAKDDSGRTPSLIVRGIRADPAPDRVQPSDEDEIFFVIPPQANLMSWGDGVEMVVANGRHVKRPVRWDEG